MCDMSYMLPIARKGGAPLLVAPSAPQLSEYMTMFCPLIMLANEDKPSPARGFDTVLQTATGYVIPRAMDRSSKLVI